MLSTPSVFGNLFFFSIHSSHLSVPKVRGCANTFTPEFDLIYTDYNGMAFMTMDISPNMSPYL